MVFSVRLAELLQQSNGFLYALLCRCGYLPGSSHHGRSIHWFEVIRFFPGHPSSFSLVLWFKA
jgi:hypothetical protein